MLVLHVVAHQVDRRVLGETRLIGPQFGPHVSIGRLDARVLGVAHVEITEYHRIVGCPERAEDPAQLPASQACRRLATVEVDAAHHQMRSVDGELRREETSPLSRRQPGVGDPGNRNPRQHKQSVVADITADHCGARVAIAHPLPTQEHLQCPRCDFLEHHDVGPALRKQVRDSEIALVGTPAVVPDVVRRQRQFAAAGVDDRCRFNGHVTPPRKQPHRSVTTTLPLAVRFSSDAMASPARSSG